MEMAERVLDEVTQRHMNIKQIETTIIELTQIFEDIAMIIQDQHYGMLEVAESMEKISKHTEDAQQHIHSALFTRLKTRKNIWVLVILGIVLCIVLGVVGVSLYER